MIIDKIPFLSELYSITPLMRVLAKITDWMVMALGTAIAVSLIIALILLIVKIANR